MTDTQYDPQYGQQPYPYQQQDQSYASNQEASQQTPQDAIRQRLAEQEAQQKAERERNLAAIGAAESERIDLARIDEMIGATYRGIDQPGLHPANKPGNTLDAERTGERPVHKSTRDLEDITGNPGHRGISPYAPATSFNPAPRADGFMASINEPDTAA